MNTTLEGLTIDELTTIANALHDRVLNTHAQIEAGTKYDYNLTELQEELNAYQKLMHKVLDIGEDLTP